ncbi:MAG: (Fe-S)-binding protein [Gammaproteobacteria bacterium]|nr:(Fe-S)-binding protein [Gammaproteobacteria bacterium]
MGTAKISLLKHSTHTDSIKQLLAASNQCVMCALCLPHCPTYRITLNEANSPRGRIALMRALLKREIPLTNKALQHLEQCMHCLNCEAMCPSKVPFSQLISNTRQQLPHQTRSYWHRLIAWLLTKPWLLDSSLTLLSYTPTWIRRITNKSKLAIGLDWNPKNLPRLKRFYPALHQQSGQVQLFTGCMKGIDKANIHAAIKLLNHIGYDVSIPAGQTCCGSFHQHHGFQQQAQALIRQNNTRLANNKGLITLSLNSACSTQLQHNNDGNHSPLDIIYFIQRHQSQDIAFSACHKRIAIHLPCSARNSLGQDREIIQILQQIPSIELFELPREGACCGAGGAYFITQTDMATQVRQPLIEQLCSLQVDIVVSSNITCALHIRNGILEAGLDIEVMHPVRLLAQHLLMRATPTNGFPPARK